MDRPRTSLTQSIFSHFSHAPGPFEGHRTITTAELREWPALWRADPHLLQSLGGGSGEAILRIDPDRLRYFSVTDPAYPHVPLLRVSATDPSPEPPGPVAPGWPADTGIRDKLWQRLVMERIAVLSQPDFALVNGNRIEASNAPWRVSIGAADCQILTEQIGSNVAPGTIICIEAVDVGFVAVFSGDGVHVRSGNPHVARHLDGSSERMLSVIQWAEFLRELCADPLPLRITKAAFSPRADLSDSLLSSPGSYILKPRFGSNGFGVVRVVSHTDGHLSAESDCPDTAQYLEDFPCVADLHGRDLVTGIATQRSRFVDRARAGLPERSLDSSILEDEIRQDRAEGSIFEPRIVIQRTKEGSAESLAVLGAICKRIDTAVGASVARDFREEPLELSLRRFLSGRVPMGELHDRVKEACDEIVTAGDRIRTALVPIIEARGARVHQFGIDCRLCWNHVTRRAEYPFLEFQFGIGRIDPSVLNSGGLAGYRSATDLRRAFGPERG